MPHTKKHDQELQNEESKKEVLNALLQNGPEAFYQRIMETYLGASHMVLNCGTTDVTTSTVHVEITAFDISNVTDGRVGHVSNR